MAIEKLRSILIERPYEFRYALRILPIEKVVPTDLTEIKRVAEELASRIGEQETFRVTVEKRFTPFHSKDIIEAAAGDIKRKADLENPDKILAYRSSRSFNRYIIAKAQRYLGGT